MVCTPAGKEPYRKLGISVNTKPSISQKECKLVVDTQDIFSKHYTEVLLCLLAHRPAGTEHPNIQSYWGVARNIGHEVAPCMSVRISLS